MPLYTNTTVKAENRKPMVFELKIENPPPNLTLLINPASLEIKFAPKISEQRTRWTGANSAYIFHAHHDELDVITASGKSAMFMTDNGLSRKDRTDSVAYRNIHKLVAIYRNNGKNVNKKPDSTQNSFGVVSPALINSIGRVVLNYNDFMYEGHFINFSLSENDASPFIVDFNFEFKVTKTFDKL
jgi:hypothetical protein